MRKTRQEILEQNRKVLVKRAKRYTRNGNSNKLYLTKLNEMAIVK